MSQGILRKISSKTAEEVCRHYRLSEDARKLLRPDLTPWQFVESLNQAGRYKDVFPFLACSLPKREAIWWACVSVRHALGPAFSPKELAALKAAVDWVLDPDESKRRSAQSAGEAAGFSTPAGCVALAVFSSGGSLIGPDLPEVAPDPFMTAQAVSASISLASVLVDPSAILDVQREIIELGIAIAEGKVTWPEVMKTAGKPATVRQPTGLRF